MVIEKKRITFRVNPDVRKKIDDAIPWGQQNMVFEAIAEDLVEMFEENEPSMVIGAIVSKKVKLSHIVDFGKNG